MKVFLSLNVYPTYGEMKARLVWQMAAGFELGKFLVYKSPDGATGWAQIGAVDNAREFVDDNLLTGSKLSENYYKVIRQAAGKRNDSDVIGTFGPVSRQEFCVAKSIMDLEFKHLRMFSAASLFKLNAGGPPCKACVDKSTGQAIGTSLCEVCYGTRIEGGYRSPVSTFLKIASTSTNARVDRPDGAGTDDPVLVEIRMMAFPVLDKEDLLLVAGSDDRYLVDTIDYSSVAGKIPVVANVKAQMLRRSDVRYRMKG